jgi:hypothetical protein
LEQVVAVARLTLVELDLVEVDVDRLLEVEVTFLTEVLTLAEDEEAFFDEVAILDEEDDFLLLETDALPLLTVADFKKPAT